MESLSDTVTKFNIEEEDDEDDNKEEEAVTSDKVALEFEEGDRDKDALGAVFGSEDEEEEEEATGDVERDCPTEFPPTLFESSFGLFNVAIVEAASAEEEASVPPTADTLFDEFARANLSFSFLSPPTSMDKDDELASVSFFSSLKNGCVSNNDRGEGREAGFTDRHLRTRS